MVYLIAESATKTGIRIRTARIYTDVEKLGRFVIQAFINWKNTSYGNNYYTNLDFKKFLSSRFSHKIYEMHENQDVAPKLMKSKAYDIIMAEDGLKKDLAKMMLKV